MVNNASLGITIQKIVCEKYNLNVHPNAVKQFEANYDVSYRDNAIVLVDNIFKDISQEPKECLTYSPSIKEGEKYSPHNFLLKNGKTLSIRTNKNKDKVAPRVVGQCGIDKFNYYFSEIAGFEIENKQQIKNIVSSNISEMLPVFLRFMFVSDYTVWVYDVSDPNGYYIFDNNVIINIDFDCEKFSFTRDVPLWNESTTLKYNGRSIAEIQIHKNRTFKFRFIFGALKELILEQVITNETFGITAEKTICDIFGLKYPSNLIERSSRKIEEELKPVMIAAFQDLPVPVKYTGSEAGERGGNSKCSYDFVLDDDLILSLKTNIGKMVCPPEVGQPGEETCRLYFDEFLNSDRSIPMSVAFKEMVYRNIEKIIPVYLCHLFDSNYLLWIRKKGDNYDFRIFDSDYVNTTFVWEKECFSFTRPHFEEWNESNTVKYKGITLGEFQVHNNRDCYKFRFNLENLSKIIGLD